MKTLQDQYKLIKEGKGHKDVFLKEAKQMFPNYIRNAATFEEASNILKDKNVISENLVGLEPINTISRKKESYETAFENFLEEARKKNDNDPNAEIKKVSQQVEDKLKNNFDRTDKKNPDNQIFGEIMKGYYCEMKDPKNVDKTEEQLRDIVLKNLAKDPIYYTKNGMFGEKGVGVEMDVPGLGEPKEPKGKYKSSGYGDLKEGKYTYVLLDKGEEVIDVEAKDIDEAGDIVRRDYGGTDPMLIAINDKKLPKSFGGIEPRANKEYHDGGVYLLFKNNKLENIMFTDDMKPNDKLANSLKSSGYEVLFTSDSRFSSPNSISKYKNKDKDQLGLESHLEEQKLRKVINSMIKQELISENKKYQKTIKEIEKAAKLAEITSKMEALDKAIEEKNSRLNSIEESEEMKELVDKKAMKELKKEVKLLESYKSKVLKMYEKLTKTKTTKKEIIDEDEIIEKEINEGPKEDSSSEIKTNWEEIKKIVNDIEKTDLFEEDEKVVPQSIINQAVVKYADTGGDDSKIRKIAALFPEYEEEIIEYLEGYDLGQDYDI